MYCSECGTAVGANDQLCPKCGAGVSFADKPTTGEPVPHDSSPVSITAESGFRDPSSLTKWLTYFLYASIIIDAIAIFAGILQYQLLSNLRLGSYSSEVLSAAAASNERRQQVVALFQLSITITTMILFAKWIYRANFNARQLGAHDLKFSPGWSIGYYFIPILNIWKPYQAMREIWQASKNPASWATVEPGAILPWWWAFFLFMNMLGQASYRISLRAKEINELSWSTGVNLVADLVSIPAAILAVVLVKQIYALQVSHVQPRF